MKVLEEIPNCTVVTPEQFVLDPKLAVHDADALIVRSAVQADAELIDAAGRVRVIGRAGVGVDNIDVEVATRRGIVVMNAPGASAVSVAELTLGLMLAMARHISRADQTTRAGKWDKKSLQGTELSGKTLGIVGLGRIGTETALRARAFGMKVVGSDPYLSPARAKELGIELALDGRPVRPGRLYFAARGADPPDGQHDQRRCHRKDEARRSPGELRPRRTGG